MTFRSISAITLSVSDMRRSIEFYHSTIGLALMHGGANDSFVSFQIGSGYLNLISSINTKIHWWGRVIIYVDHVDDLYNKILASGWHISDRPQDAQWGERYFHVMDPDGHELSFASPIINR